MQPTQNIDPDRFVRRVGDFYGFRFQGLGFEWDMGSQVSVLGRRGGVRPPCSQCNSLSLGFLMRDCYNTWAGASPIGVSQTVRDRSVSMPGSSRMMNSAPKPYGP